MDSQFDVQYPHENKKKLQQIEWNSILAHTRASSIASHYIHLIFYVKWKIELPVWVLIHRLRKTECSVIFIWRSFACHWRFQVTIFGTSQRTGMWNLCFCLFMNSDMAWHLRHKVFEALKWMVLPFFNYYRDSSPRIGVCVGLSAISTLSNVFVAHCQFVLYLFIISKKRRSPSHWQPSTESVSNR